MYVCMLSKLRYVLWERIWWFWKMMSVKICSSLSLCISAVFCRKWGLSSTWGHCGPSECCGLWNWCQGFQVGAVLSFFFTLCTHCVHQVSTMCLCVSSRSAGGAQVHHEGNDPLAADRPIVVCGHSHVRHHRPRVLHGEVPHDLLWWIHTWEK